MALALLVEVSCCAWPIVEPGTIEVKTAQRKKRRRAGMVAHVNKGWRNDKRGNLSPSTLGFGGLCLEEIGINDEFILQAVRIVKERRVLAVAIFRAVARRVFNGAESGFFKADKDLGIKAVDVLTAFGAEREMIVVTDCASGMRNGGQLGIGLDDADFVRCIEVPSLPVFVTGIVTSEFIAEIAKHRAVKL